jgi:glycosyltransferase involved in cell wall biosynthesis
MGRQNQTSDSMRMHFPNKLRLFDSRMSMEKANTIVVVAPYSPIGSNANPALGAAKKIASVIGALTALGSDVILVNSAHNKTRRSRLKHEQLEISAGLTINVITPPTYASRPLGKALNVMQARSIAADIARGGASLLWIYNGYAFECRFALEFIGQTGCPLVIELEDMPFARKRPGNIKPRLDDYYMKRVLPMASMVTCVNDVIPDTLHLARDKIYLLPGLVDRDLIEASAGRQPFSTPRFTAGYFGNLSAEKGADLVLRLSENLPPDWQLAVTGSGPLAPDFFRLAKRHPERLKFTANASGQELLANMFACDAIINPHAPISNMGDGVFPFKVIEALASGRLVISTPLPKCGIDLESSVLFVDHDVNSLSNALSEAGQFYNSRKSGIEATAREARRRFSQDALTEVIRGRFFPTVRT